MFSPLCIIWKFELSLFKNEVDFPKAVALKWMFYITALILSWWWDTADKVAPSTAVNTDSICRLVLVPNSNTLILKSSVANLTALPDYLMNKLNMQNVLYYYFLIGVGPENSWGCVLVAPSLPHLYF